MSSLRDGSARGVLMGSRLNQAKWMALSAFTARVTNRPVGVRSANDELPFRRSEHTRGFLPRAPTPKPSHQERAATQGPSLR